MTTKPCAKCGETMTLDLDAGVFRCPNGHRVFETLEEAQERLKAARKDQPAAMITHRGTVDHRARSLFDSGVHYAHLDKTADAIDAFQDALGVQPDFADAHLWLARLHPDPKVRRGHLEEILAHHPGHIDAMRMLMVMDGKMTPEEAERSQNNGEIELRRVEVTQAETQTLICPVCGGRLTIDEINNRVVCNFCGHTAPLDDTRTTDDGAQILGAALLKRRAAGVKWQIGGRMLACSQCGAQRTIPARKLSATCPFCGSNQVVVQDAVQSIEQPDGIAPFLIGEDQAQALVRERLKNFTERVYMLNDGNRVARAALEGVYLPFWVFDALAEVSQTIIDKRVPNSRDAVRFMQPYQNVRFQDGMTDVVVPAVESPSKRLVAGLGEFDLRAAVAYDPKLLAKYPAELYSIDFDDASLSARSAVARSLRERHSTPTTQQQEINVSVSVLSMTFRLLLLPVWVGVLFERDGDVRSALVNGQTGAVALGRAGKAENDEA